MRLSEIFRSHKKCFIPFVTAGHPDLEATRRIILELARAGSHVVEIGIPFSDPIADGPVIQCSSFEALKHGYGIHDYLGLVEDLRRETDVGLIFMTYMNPILSYGLKRLEKEGSRVGLDGILVSDLTPEEYERMEPLDRLDTIFLAAPTSSDSRLERIARTSRGFIYLVARTGVTGVPSELLTTVPPAVERLRRFSDLPIAVGFGIRSSEDVRRVWCHADGAVVGSTIVDFIEKHREEPDLASLVGEYARNRLIPA